MIKKLAQWTRGVGPSCLLSIHRIKGLECDQEKNCKRDQNVAYCQCTKQSSVSPTLNNYILGSMATQ